MEAVQNSQGVLQGLIFKDFQVRSNLCQEWFKANARYNKYFIFMYPGSCAHGRAWEYFTETILDSKIWACKSSTYKEFIHTKHLCKDQVLFGLRVPPR